MCIETLNWEIQHNRFIYNISTFQISTCVTIDLVSLAHGFKLMEEFEIVSWKALIASRAVSKVVSKKKII